MRVARWCALTSTLAQSSEVEIAQLHLLFATFDELLARVAQQRPDIVELAALATVLHTFYNGAENCFVAIARQYDQEVPNVARWHRGHYWSR